jgi:molecular chaperone Hsp33
VTAVSPTRAFADSLSRFVFEGAAVRGALASLDGCCGDILACHPYPPALRRVLAELLAASALLASTLKFKGSLIAQLRGEGPVRMLVVECDAALTLRATAQWDHDAAALPATADLATLAGGSDRARFAITLDPKDGGPLYQGIVGLEAASVATLIEHYLTTSEQIESRLVLATEGDSARGLLLQRLPGAGPADDATWERASAAAAALGPGDLFAAASPEGFLCAQFPDRDIRLFEPCAARFACGCSEARIGNALRLLGRAEIDGILVEQGRIGVTCEFCSRQYTFVAADARALFVDAPARGLAPRAAPPDGIAH